MKLSEIAKSWVLYAARPANLQELSKQRLDICDGCPHKKQLNRLGKAIVTSINEHGSTYLCGQCGCPLAAKTINPNSECPLGKWKRVDNSSYF